MLWHTALAFSERLLRAAALPAEKLDKEAASLAAERLSRHQATPAIPAVKEQDEGGVLCPVIRHT